MGLPNDILLSAGDLHIESLPAKRKIIAGLDIHVRRGQILGLLGPSGCGKSTLLNWMAGLLQPQKGWQVGGTVRTNPVLDYIPGGVDLIFQNPSWQLFRPTPRDEIENAGNGRSPGNLLETFGLEHLMDRNIRDLSSGEKAAVALACAARREPSLLLMDEPTANLDVEKRELLKEWLLSEKRKRNLACVIVEHSTWLLSLCDEIRCICEEGIFTCSPAEAEERMIPDLPAPSATPGPAGYDVFLSVENLRIPEIKGALGRGVSFHLRKGECLGLWGPNGCGKSTLLGALAGLWNGKGKIIVDGKAWKKRKDRVGNCSLVAQDPQSQLFCFSAAEEISHPMRNFKTFSRDYLERVLCDFDLKKCADRSIVTLSYGEQQRVTLATALASEPQLLLLDEPTHGMSRAYMESFHAMMETYRQQGGSIIVASHELPFLEAAADRILEFHDDRLEPKNTGARR